MFERFTDTTRRAVHLASEEARMLDHSFVGTEHLLLGLLNEGESLAFKALRENGVDLSAVRSVVEAINGRGSEPISGHVPHSPRALKAMRQSLQEALYQGHSYVAPEHLLLGLLRTEGISWQVLGDLGIDVHVLRATVLEKIHPRQ